MSPPATLRFDVAGSPTGTEAWSSKIASAAAAGGCLRRHRHVAGTGRNDGRDVEEHGRNTRLGDAADAGDLELVVGGLVAPGVRVGRVDATAAAADRLRS